MRMTWFMPAALLVLTACSAFPFFQQGEVSHPDVDGRVSRVDVLMQDIRFDGETLSGRFLVGAVDQSIRLDKRLIESAYLTTESVQDCAAGAPLSFAVMDVYAASPRDEDILVLEPGHWYGKEVRIPLFTRSLSGPECIEVEFAFRAIGGRTVATLRVRAERDSRPTPDAGMPAPDAG